MCSCNLSASFSLPIPVSICTSSSRCTKYSSVYGLNSSNGPIVCCGTSIATVVAFFPYSDSSNSWLLALAITSIADIPSSLIASMWCSVLYKYKSVAKLFQDYYV